MKKNIDISDPAFRERFRRLRDGLNLTQAELAVRATVSSRTVNNVESARDVAQEKTLRLLAEALGVTFEELLHGPPEPEPGSSPPAVAPPPPVAAPRRRVSTVLIMVAVAIAIFAGGFAINEWRVPSRVNDDAIPVSVTCFDNLANPDDTAHLGMIVRDLVVNGLSESRYVRVISRPDIDHKDPEKHYALERQAAAAAGVPWVLFGSILQEYPRLVLNARVENTVDGTVLVTQTVTAADGETVFDAAARLAAHAKRDLFRALGEHTETGLPIARVTTRSIKAYRHYIAGVENLNKLYREEARAELRRAVYDDTTFAMAMIMLTHPEIAGARAERDSLLAVARRYASGLMPRERYYLDAYDAWSRHDLRGTVSALEAMVEDYPQEAEAYRLMGRIYNSLREPARSLAALKTAVEVDPFDGMSLNRLGYRYAELGDFERAMDCIDRYVRMAPAEANPYDSRGDMLAWSGHPEEAIASYQQALHYNPRFFPAMQNLGCTLTLTGRYDEAESCFRRMLGSEDTGARSRARWFLGMVDVYRGRLDRAETNLRDALAADDLEQDRSSAYAQKLCALASIEAARGHVSAAVDMHRAAMDSLPRPTSNAPSEWFVSYVCLLSRVDLDAARAARDSLADRLEAIGSKGNHALSACDGWLQLRGGEPAAACRSFEAAIAGRDLFQYRYPLALAYLEAGRVDDAIRTLEYSLNRYSSDRILHAIWGVKMYYHLGRAYELAGRHDDARAMYARFLDTWDGADPAFDEIGDAHQRIAVLDQAP